MNKDPNKRGRGGSPRKRKKDLGRNTYIQEIITKAEAEASSWVIVRVRTHTHSEGQSIEQQILPLGARTPLSTAEGEEVESKESKKVEVLFSTTKEEEVASRGLEKEINPSAHA